MQQQRAKSIETISDYGWAAGQRERVSKWKIMISNPHPLKKTNIDWIHWFMRGSVQYTSLLLQHGPTPPIAFQIGTFFHLNLVTSISRAVQQLEKRLVRKDWISPAGYNGFWGAFTHQLTVSVKRTPINSMEKKLAWLDLTINLRRALLPWCQTPTPAFWTWTVEVALSPCFALLSLLSHQSVAWVHWSNKAF